MAKVQLVIFLSVILYSSATHWDSSEEENCPSNCIYRKCMKPCPKTCESIISNLPCDKNWKCTAGCECKDGTVLSKIGGDCIPIAQCPKKTCTKKNGIYKDIPCSKTCANMFGSSSCTPATKPGCQCDTGFFLNSKDECVENYECSALEVTCPEDETFSTCATPCKTTCANMFTQICDHKFECDIRCECDAGFVLDSRNKCIQIADCSPDEVVCPANKKFDKCGSLNGRTCENMYQIMTKSATCQPDCCCSEGTVFDGVSGTCIPPYACANSLENRACKSIDPNMDYYPIHSSCQTTCTDQTPVCNGGLVSGCFCKGGYVLNQKHKCIPVGDCCMCSI